MTSGSHQTSHPAVPRTPLSCCQGGNNNRSVNDVRIVPGFPIGKYVIKKKHVFPKRPEVNLSFNNIRYRIKQWSLRQITPSISHYKHHMYMICINDYVPYKNASVISKLSHRNSRNKKLRSVQRPVRM